MKIANFAGTVSDDRGVAALSEAAVHLATSVTTLAGAVAKTLGQDDVAEKVSGELRQARAIGQFTVLTAVAKAKRALAERSEPVVDSSPVTRAPAPTIPDEPSAIPGYTNLAANQIVPLLHGLTDDERAEVLAFERATRSRRTILSALGS
jgi:hypothetical protein